MVIFKYSMAGCRSPAVTTNVTVYPLLSSVSSTNLYLWGLDLSGQSGGRASPQAAMQGAGGVGGLLALTRSNVFCYPLCDANGHQKSAKPKPVAQGGRDFKAVRMHGARSGIPRHSGNCHVTEYLTFAGVLTAHYEYDAFGQQKSAKGKETRSPAAILRLAPARARSGIPRRSGNCHITAKSGQLADEFKFRFSTKYLDKETGLVQHNHRYYAPKFHAFISTDPIEERGGLNLYGFCGNDPINRWDYLGMFGLPDPDELMLLHLFSQLAEQLQNQLQSMCPTSETPWEKFAMHKTMTKAAQEKARRENLIPMTKPLCCDPKKCNEEAESMAKAYIAALYKAFRARKVPVGGNRGNSLIRQCGGEGLTYPDHIDPGLICDGWQDMACKVLSPITNNSKCWSYYTKTKGPYWYQRILFSFEGGHSWGELQIMNGESIRLDPWKSAGWRYN